MAVESELVNGRNIQQGLHASKSLSFSPKDSTVVTKKLTAQESYRIDQFHFLL